MIEISLAVAAADRAYKLLKTGIERKKELEDMGFAISSFFDAKDNIAIATAKARNPSAADKFFNSGSVEAYAFEIVRAEKKARELEERVKLLFWRERGGQALYQKMLRIRQVERTRRIQAAREAARRKKLISDLILATILIVSGIGIIGFLIYFIFKNIG